MRFRYGHSIGFAVIAVFTVFISLINAPTFAVTIPVQCKTANLSFGLGNRLSPSGGEHGDLYVLINHGNTACQLHGYPGVSFYDAKHQILPFRYARGQGQWVTHEAPRLVVLPPGRRAFFLIAKYRCDIGDSMMATSVRIYPPNERHQLIGSASDGAGVSELHYCKGGTNDPGNIVYISPVVSNARTAVPAMVH